MHTRNKPWRTCAWLLVIAWAMACGPDPVQPATDDTDVDTTPDVVPDPCEVWPPLGRDVTFEGETALADMEAFCDRYSGVAPGRVLTVRNTGLTDLDALDCVCTAGTLIVEDNPDLVDLTLPRLRDATSVTLSGNPSLRRLRVPDLRTVGYLSITGARIDTLDVGQAKGERLMLTEALVDPAPDAPTPSGSDFQDISVSTHAGLTTLAGLPCQDGGVLRVDRLAGLTRPELPACTQALDELSITSELDDLTPLRSVSVARRLTLALGPELNSLDGLQGTSSTLVSLLLVGGSGVTNVDGLSHLEQIGRLSMEGLGATRPPFELSILPLDGLVLRDVAMTEAPWRAPQRNATRIVLDGVPWTDLKALEGTTAASRIELRRLPVRNLNALASLERVREDLILEDLPELADVTALHGLELGGELSVVDCPKLSDEAIAAWRATLR